MGDRCAIDPTGQPIEPHHFLPRRLMGEYLQWFYRALLAGAPESVHIVHHPTAAVDVVARRDGSEEVRLANGAAVVADHVIVTSGHTANQGTDDVGRVARALSGWVVRRHDSGRRDGRRVRDGIGGGRRGDGADHRAGRRVRREWRWAALPAQRPRAAAPAVLPERSAVHRQVGHGKGPHRRLQAADLHRRGSRRAQRPLEWPQTAGRRAERVAPSPVRRDVRALLRAGRLPGVGGGSRWRRGARAATRCLGRWPLRRGTGASRRALRQLRRRGAVLRPPAQLPLQRRLRAIRLSVAGRRPPRGGGARRRQPGEVGRPGVPDLPGQDAFGGGARGTVARLLSRLQCRHLQPDPSPRCRSAGAALAADARADGRRGGADAVRSRSGSRPGRDRSRTRPRLGLASRQPRSTSRMWTMSTS